MRRITAVLAGLLLLSLLFCCGPATPVTELTDGLFVLHVIDVGQGDSLLLKLPDGRAGLVDAGEAETGAVVGDYIRSLGIRELAFIVATHPHSDHIGGLPAVLGRMRTERIYMPDASASTETFERFLDAVERSRAQRLIPEAGQYLEGAEDTDFSILVAGPIRNDYTGLNDHSIVLYVRYGETSFLLTGDAEALSEEDMLKAEMPLRADVLKLGHHGSSSSSSESFLAAVSPRYAVISCGAGNDYGHPAKQTLTRLAVAGTAVFRTDELGTVIFTSDGERITLNKPVPDIAGNSGAEDGAFIGNKNSRIFHTNICGSLPAEQNRVFFKSREEAENAGYTPCRTCKP